MKIINKPRGAGKTTDLIKMSAETNIPILCFCNRSAKFIEQRAGDEFNLDIPTPIYVGMKDMPPEVLVDDIEYVLGECLNTRVRVATMTGEVESTTINEWGII